MGLALKHFGDHTRTIWLYDTFEGITEPEPWEIGIGTKVNLLSRWKEKQVTGGWMVASEERVRTLMHDIDCPHKILVGDIAKLSDFPETIALLRLDMDIYSPTKFALKRMYPNLSDKGVIIFDDYGSWSGVRKAADDYFKGRLPLLSRVDASCRIGIKA